MKNQKSKLDSVKVSRSKIKKFLGASDLVEPILWILSIPKYEWSDSMLKAYQEMIDTNQNEVWLASYFNDKLKEEFLEYLEWSNSMNA